MDVQWLHESTSAIMGICLIAAIAECAVISDRSNNSLQLICGIAAASSILRMTVDFVKMLF